MNDIPPSGVSRASAVAVEAAPSTSAAAINGTTLIRVDLTVTSFPSRWFSVRCALCASQRERRVRPRARSRRTRCRTSQGRDRKSTRLNSSHQIISYAVFCLKKKKLQTTHLLLSTNRQLEQKRQIHFFQC